MSARCEWLRVAASKRRRGVTPGSPRNDLLREKHRGGRTHGHRQLTVRYLDQLKPHGKRYEVFDTIVPGLAIRVTAAGHKTFTLYYRHHGRMRRVGLGRYPDVLLAEARKIATQHRGRIFDGADPAEREEDGARAGRQHGAGALSSCIQPQGEGLKQLDEDRRIMEKEVLPVWRHLRVVDVKRRDVRELVERKAQARASQGNRVLVADLRDVHVRRWSRIGSKRIRRGGSTNRARNAVAIACSSRDELPRALGGAA